ncbi:hypothetical protein B0181_04320 [Moraxella caviae]|uniref:DUF11 domain-containing protein n=1 Tax=Moraxella caviae TaxID=34060 RepID=A0A1T0A5I9_9GAMM|nr:hypothetical protein B0181_04320 [Moraxella caviae]
MNAFVVSKDAAGNETLTPVGMNTPISKGQIVEYQGLFTNHGTNRVRKMVATMDIPKGAELVGNIEPAIAQATMDGGRFVNMPIRVSVNGQAQELPLANYKGLRWTIEELGIGATAVVKYRAKIQ